MATLKARIKKMTETEEVKEIQLPYFGFGNGFKYVKIIGPERVVTVSLNRTFCSIADVYSVKDVFSWDALKEISENEFNDALEEAYNRLKQTLQS